MSGGGSSVAPPNGTIVFAGGGTGGHIFPGLAIAEHLTRSDPAAVFFHSTRPLDAELLGERRVPGVPIPASPLSVRPRGLLRFVRDLGRGIGASREALKALDARAVALMGGFVSPGVAVAARSIGVPTLLVNLDAVPGKANRLSARFASAHVTAVSGGAVPGDWVEVGPIVRREARATRSTGTARRKLGLDPSMRTLVVMGGSQGAGSINAMMGLVARGIGGAGWQVLHLAGRGRESAVREAYSAAGCRARVVGLLDEIGLAWSAADLVLGRCGAGTVAEARLAGVPCVFMPYPHHRDRHQALNAEPMAEAGAAVIVEDFDNAVRNAGAEGAGSVVLRLLGDASELGRMKEAAGGMGQLDGAAAAAERLRAMAAMGR